MAGLTALLIVVAIIVWAIRRIRRTPIHRQPQVPESKKQVMWPVSGQLAEPPQVTPQRQRPPGPVGVNQLSHEAAAAQQMRTRSPAQRQPEPSQRLHPPGVRPGASQRVYPAAVAPPEPAYSWIPQGQDIFVARTMLKGGFLYVGTGLPAANGSGTEPALIDPTLPVDLGNPDWQGETMGYWPCYAEISPRARAAYLAWLAGGRVNPNAYVGYVFLYFYGVERRLLTDSPSPDERAMLVTEVRRLLSLYGSNRSFHGYARGLLDAVAILDPEIRYDRSPPPTSEWSYELPMDLRVGLGQLVVAGRPIPAEWAVAWYSHHPDTHLRTPAIRCADEFGELFTKSYHARFGDGLIVKPNKARLSTRYRPASSGFPGTVELTNPALPDVGRLIGPITKLRDLVEGVTGDLDAYSRHLGRNPDGAGSPSALALLPEGVTHKPNPETEALWSWAAQRIDGVTRGVASAQELIARWPINKGKLTKADAVAVAQLLERRGLGIEPDVRFGGATPTPTSSIVLFRRAEQQVSAPSSDYAAALAIINLGMLVAAADGTVSEPERKALRELAIDQFDLSEDERLRLDAHAAVVLAKPPTPAALKRRLESLPTSRRAAVGRLLTTIAAADGQVTPDEIRTLERLFTTLGLAPGEVYGTLHAAATATDELTHTEIPGARRTGRKLPAAPCQRHEAAATLALDPERLARTRAESVKVAAELADIFTDDEPALSPPSPDTALAGGLDAAHSRLLQMLVEREAWSRADFDALAAGAGLLPDGALDVLNDAAYDHTGEPLCEGFDPIEINQDIVKDMLG